MIFKNKIGIGTAILGRKESDDTYLDFVIDNGCRLFDTAEKYGNGDSEKAIGRAIKRSNVDRSEFEINTKFTFQLDPVKSLEDSLSRLQTDYVDSYMIHWLIPKMREMSALKGLISTLMELKINGKTKHFGATLLSDSELAVWLKAERELGIPVGEGMEVVQYRYSLLRRDADMSLNNDLFELGLTAMPYSPFGGGRMTGSGVPPQPGYHGDFWDNENTKKLALVAESIGATLPQFILAWCTRFSNMVAFPTSMKQSHFLENQDSLKFIPLITKTIYDQINQCYPISFSVHDRTPAAIEKADNKIRESLPD